MTNAPYPISGVITDTDGSTALQAVVVTARLIRNLDNQYLPASARSVTNSSGEYTIDLANFSNDYQNGDFVKIYYFKPSSLNFEAHETQIDTAVGSESKNITTQKVTYATPQEVAETLGMSGLPSIDSQPNAVEICEKIVDAEDYINQMTRHSWKSVTVSNEVHSTGEGPFLRGSGIPINLQHRAIKSFDSSEGDKIEKWTGISTNDGYEQWQTTKTEGRNDDFWFDLNLGKLFLKTSTIRIPFNVRVTYRYGESTVPSDVRMATRFLVASHYLASDVRMAAIPEGSQGSMSASEKIAMWKKYIDKVIEERAEIGVTNLPSTFPTT